MATQRIAPHSEKMGSDLGSLRDPRWSSASSIFRIIPVNVCDEPQHGNLTPFWSLC